MRAPSGIISPHEVPISRVCKEPSKLNDKKTNNPRGTLAKDLNEHFTKEGRVGRWHIRT